MPIPVRWPSGVFNVELNVVCKAAMLEDDASAMDDTELAMQIGPVNDHCAWSLHV